MLMQLFKAKFKRYDDGIKGAEITKLLIPVNIHGWDKDHSSGFQNFHDSWVFVLVTSTQPLYEHQK
jgi:nitrogenase molybdenum-iron protein alpha/beta subunit